MINPEVLRQAGMSEEEIKGFLEYSQNHQGVYYFLNFLALCFVASMFAYLAFGIIFLIDDKDICEDESPLWIYSLVSIVILVTQNMITSSLSPLFPGNQRMRQWSASVFLNYSLVTYGTVILFTGDYVCDNMKQTGLWVFALVTFTLNIFSGCFFLALIISTCHSKKIPQKSSSVASSDVPSTEEERSPLYTSGVNKFASSPPNAPKLIPTRKLDDLDDSDVDMPDLGPIGESGLLDV